MDVEAQRYKSILPLCRDQFVRGVGRNSLTQIQNGKKKTLQPPQENQKMFYSSEARQTTTPIEVWNDYGYLRYREADTLTLPMVFNGKRAFRFRFKEANIGK